MKKNYEMPQIEEIKVNVEQGFAVSGGGGSLEGIGGEEEGDAW